MRFWIPRTADRVFLLLFLLTAVQSLLALPQDPPASEAAKSHEKNPDYESAEAKVKERSSPQLASELAQELLRAGLLEDAEKVARLGLEIDFAAYLERPGSPAAKRPEPLSEAFTERLRAAYRSEIASCTLALGLVLIKRGQTEEGERLVKQTEDSGAVRTAAQFSTLAESAEARGDQEAALKYMMRAALAGPLSPEARARLETLYANARGYAKGLDDELDNLYREILPNPVSIGVDSDERARAEAPILAELFTGAGCPPCVGEDLALEAAMRKYSKQELLVLMYHVHIPRPDPLTNPWTVARQRYYGVRSAPYNILDGVVALDGGGPRSTARALFNRREAALGKLLGKAALARLRVSARLSGATVRVKAEVDQLKRAPGKVRLHLALVEEEVRYVGENGLRLHPMVVRSLAGKEAQGLPLSAGKRTEIEHAFDLGKISQETRAYLEDYEENGKFGKMKFREKKHELNPDRLLIVAFLQDQSDKTVLQAAEAAIER